jgi:tetratricopeptide (TPR) repeat protein
MAITHISGPVMIFKGFRCAAAFLCMVSFGTTIAMPIQPWPGPAQQMSGDQKQTPLSDKMNDAYAALNKQDYASAETLFKEASSLDPKSPLPALGLAELARIGRRPADVEKWLKTALALAPKNAAVLNAWGLWHVSRNETRKAEEFWQKAVLADPQATAPLVNLGDLYVRNLHKPDKAIGFYRKALQIDPSHAGAHYALGIALLETRDVPNSMKEFETSAQLAPKNPLPLYMLARTNVIKKEYQKAIELYDRALVIQPDFYPARLEKSDALIIIGKSDMALQELQSVVKLQPALSLAQLKLGMLYEKQKMYPDAMAAYVNAVKADPKTAVAYNNMAALAAAHRERLDLALEWANNAVRLMPQEPAFQDTLAAVYRSRGETDKAITVLQKITAGSKRPLAVSYYQLGLLYADKGRKQDALNAFRKALQINSEFDYASDTRTRIKQLEVQ